MANYNNNANSFINGLSDFWLLYFKEIDQLEEMYKGTEILVGQGYLDLMALLLNSSVQDTTLFNKEYFKLLRIRECDIRYRQVTSASTGRYVYNLPNTVVDVRHLNNKIFNPTLSLDKDVEFLLNTDDRTLAFTFDPLNAYLDREFGALDSAFIVRSLLRVPEGYSVRIWLDDTGGPVSVTTSGYDVAVSYDGPANTSTTTALDIVQALNLHPLASQIIVAYVSGTGRGVGSPSGTAGYTYLEKVSNNPLDNVANRTIEVSFAGSLTCPTVSNWIPTGVEKGDILRLLGSPTVGESEDLEINLVRAGTLYLKAGGSSNTASGDKQNFVVLRRTEENLSDREPLGISGQVTQSGADGTLTAATYELTSPTAVFSQVNRGDLIELVGATNAGYFPILQVVNPNTVVLGANSLIDETPIGWSLITTIDPINVNTDGVIVDNTDGTATFTAASASFPTATAGTVLRVYNGGSWYNYEVRSWVSSTSLLLTATAPITGSGLTWGWARYKPPTVTVAYSPPVAWIDSAATVVVTGRRLLDGQAVVEGRDYIFSSNTGVLQPLTVWQPAVNNTITYRYLLAVFENITALQAGADGTITPGTTPVFSSPTAIFDSTHVGQAINLSNSGLIGTTNNGVHFIKKVLSSTTVELTDDLYVPGTADPNNGTLIWKLQRRGIFTNTAITTLYESAYWCPDVLVDRFHLYVTYGYLINRLDRSSEEYRSLIRGIFQLFMLGPTLERFESALNTISGLPVIRDTGEILVSYTSGAEASGSDGIFIGATNTFTAASAAFTPADTSKYIYAVSGFNSNKLFKILSVVSPTQVVLETTPTSDGPISWELSSTHTQIVKTSRTSYEFDRRVPLRSEVTASASVGTKIFRAFEVLTDVFAVTDYLETSHWWEFVQIPREIMPNQPSLRRQSSPALFENVVNAADDACIGDPGFYVGADSDGIVPTRAVIRTGIADGVLISDPHYPFSNTVYFESATGAFTLNDVGNYLSVTSGLTQGAFLIEERLSSTRVKIQSFVPVVSGSLLQWQVLTGTLPKRHKAAFVILDKLLKYHLFQVQFDLTLLDVLSSNILVDMQELVFVAKPSYTYIAVTPFALFDERIGVAEDLDERTVIYPGGLSGSVVAGNTNPLLVIGASWRIGTWFRYLDATSTFSAPAASIPVALGAADPGYQHYLNKAYITPAAFTSNGTVIPVAALVEMSTATGTGSLTQGSDTAVLTVGVASFSDSDITQYITISGSGLGNDGVYRITRVISPTEVEIYSPLTVSELLVSWTFTATGSDQGKLSVVDGGMLQFVDYAGRTSLSSGNIGDYVRRPYVNNVLNQSFRINEILSTTAVLLAEEHRVSPVASDPDVEVSVTSGTLTVAAPGSIVFSKSMCSSDRARADYATRNKDRFYVEFSTGVNVGTRFFLTSYVSANSVVLDPPPIATLSDYCHVSVIRTPDAVDELSSWELVREQIVLDTDTIQLPLSITQDINPAVPYTAYGVREPIDPTTAVFDATLGDTYYSIGMADPRQHRGKSRTGRDTDLREEPIQITRTP